MTTKDLIVRLSKHLRGVHEPSRRWFRDFSTYHHGMTWWEFWVRYALARECFNDVVKTDGEHAAFFTEWPLYRQAWRNRNRTWFHVLGRMTKKTGRLLDYGCGNGDMLRWLRRRRPNWQYTGVDLRDTPHFTYARQLSWPILITGDYDTVIPHDVVVCEETLEHLLHPIDTVHQLKSHLRPGGILLWDYINDGQGKNRSLTLLTLGAPETETSGVYVRR